jgi:hypothetical protein
MTSRRAGWAIRAFFFALAGVLTFIVQPPGATAEKAQLAAYLLVGLGLLAWALVDMYPPAARYRTRVLPVLLPAVSAGTAVRVAGRAAHPQPPGAG